MNIKKISNGNINNVFYVSDDDKQFIIRISKGNNSFEKSVLELLNDDVYLGPKIIYQFNCNNNFIMICDYIKGKNPAKLNKNIVKGLADNLIQLHNVNIKKLTNDSNMPTESITQLKYYFNCINKTLKNEDRLFLTDKIKKIEKLDMNCFPQSLIHSDIKRENILVDKEKIYLIDFGNCYIGPRIIDIIRVAMWFFIRDKNNLKYLKQFLEDYNLKLTEEERKNLDLLFDYCIVYNYVKDIYLYEQKLLSNKYIKNVSNRWLYILKKGKKQSNKVKEVIYNA